MRKLQSGEIYYDPKRDLLVHNDTNGVSSNIVNSSGFTVIELVWHTLVDGTIDDNIYIVANSVSGSIL